MRDKLLPAGSLGIIKKGNTGWPAQPLGGNFVRDSGSAQHPRAEKLMLCRFGKKIVAED